MNFRTVKEIDERINYKDSVIDFKIILAKRRTLSIIVYPDSSVKVRAPHRASVKAIKKSVETKADWILKKQQQLKKLGPVQTEKKYEQGEQHQYLGKQYDLKISRDIVNRVDIEKDNIHIRMTKVSSDKAKKLLDKWYQENAKELFFERLDICKHLVAEIGIKHRGAVKFRKMRSMWGSCARDGKITLSYELMKAPIECIDYVIVHELCHLVEFNHSKEFYSLLDKVMPDWKFRKNKLKEIRNYIC